MKRLFVFLAFVAASISASAQCAMCKAVAEGGSEGVATGLNSGIIYLMFLPYLLIGVIGFLIYRHRKNVAARKGA